MLFRSAPSDPEHHDRHHDTHDKTLGALLALHILEVHEHGNKGKHAKHNDKKNVNPPTCDTEKGVKLTKKDKTHILKKMKHGWKATCLIPEYTFDGEGNIQIASDKNRRAVKIVKILDDWAVSEGTPCAARAHRPLAPSTSN